MAQSYDPDVLSFLKQRNAPLTHANYNSVLQQMESNPSLRPSSGAQVAEPDRSDSTYDGGLDELNLGDDAKSSSKSGGGGKQAIPALKGAGAVEPGNKSQPNIKDDAQAENTREQRDTPTHSAPSGGTQLAQGGAWDKILGPLAGAAAGGLGAAGVYSLLNRDGGAPPSPGAAGVEPPDLMRGVDATATPTGEPGAGGELDMLAGHAPPAALPPSAGGPISLAPPQQAAARDPAQMIAALQADRLQSDLGGHAAGSPSQSFTSMAGGGMPQQGGQLPSPTGQGSPSPLDNMARVTPGAAPSSPVVPMPDNAGSGMLESLMQRLKSVPPEHLAQLVQALKAAGHIR